MNKLTTEHEKLGRPKIDVINLDKIKKLILSGIWCEEIAKITNISSYLVRKWVRLYLSASFTVKMSKNGEGRFGNSRVTLPFEKTKNLILSGKSGQEIADIMGIHQTTANKKINRYFPDYLKIKMKKNGIKKAGRGCINLPLDEIKKFILSGKICPEIADIMGVSRTTMYNKIKCDLSVSFRAMLRQNATSRKDNVWCVEKNDRRL